MPCKHRNRHHDAHGPRHGTEADTFFQRLKRIERDPKRGKLAGVCAGIARTMGWNVLVVRLAALIFLVMNAPVAIGLYLLAYALLGTADTNAAAAATPPPKAEETAEPTADQGLPESLKFEALRRKFRDLEERAAGLEKDVTSGDYSLKQRFREI